MKYLILLSLTLTAFCLNGQISATYIFGTIPTNLQDYAETCEEQLFIQLPAGEDVVVLGVNIRYEMTAFDQNWMSDQRSRVRCMNTGVVEPTVAGVGSSNGTFVYQRDNVNIANGTYPGGTLLEFQMEAYRTFDDGSSPDCGSEANRVDNGTWTIEVIVDQQIPLVGVNTSTPDQSLSVDGKVSIGNDFKAPTPGTMRYNEATESFEGWTGASWKSMSYSPMVYSYEQNPLTQSFSSNLRDSLIAFPDSLLIEEPGTYMCLFDLTFFDLAGNTTSLTSDRNVIIYFTVFNSNNFRYLGPNVVGLPAGFTYYFRNREVVQMHKIIEITNPNTYMNIRYQITSNPCCSAPTGNYAINDVKMTAIKLD